MNQSYFLKNLPIPLAVLVRPMLLISLSLHGLLLALPLPSQPKHQASKKQPQKVKITQLANAPSSPTPKPSPQVSAKATPVVPKPKATPVVRQPIRTQFNLIRPPSYIPPVPPPRSIPRSQPQPTPIASPSLLPSTATPSPSPTIATETLSPSPLPSTQTLSPSPLPSTATPSPSPSTATPSSSPSTAAASPNSGVVNPFANFPIPPNTERGSLGLLSGDLDEAARNTTDGLGPLVGFYKSALAEKKFSENLVTDDPDLKIYEVSKDTGEVQFLHLISIQGKTVIVLASEQVKDVRSLVDAAVRTPEEIAFFDIMKQIENDPNLSLATVERERDVATLPEPNKFADPNKFEFRSKTVPFKPISPEQLYTELEAQLHQKGFTQISKEATYGGGITYKVIQGNFTRYVYLVPSAENRTYLILSKDSPF